MSNGTVSRLQFSKVLNVAMSPSKIVGIVEKSPYLREMGISIKGCEVRKVRPTKDGALELEYRFKLLKSSTADKFTAMILGKIYQDEKGEREYKKLLESLKSKGPLFADSSLKGFVLYIPGLRLLLRSPSTDEKLPSLQVALDPEAMKPFLGGYLNTNIHGRESISKCEVDLLRYRPRKRCVVRYRVEALDLHASQIHRGSFIGKIYGNREEGENVFTIMLELDRRGFGRDSSDGIKIPCPLGYIRELHMVLMEDVVAPPLSESFSSPHLVDHLKAVARALVKIHACSLKMARKYQVEDEVSNLKRWVPKAIQVNPDLTGSFEASLTGIITSAHDVHCHEPVLIHRDFYSKQLFLGSDEVTIVDFDTLCNADPAIDIGKFLAHLKCKGVELQWTEEKARSHGETFLAAYRPCIPPELRTRIGFYYRTSLLRWACYFTLRSKWRNLTASLLAEAGKGYPF